MTAAKAIEYRIIRQLLDHAQGDGGARSRRVVERLIAIVGATAMVFVLGAYLQELLGVLFVGGVIALLGTSD